MEPVLPELHHRNLVPRADRRSYFKTALAEDKPLDQATEELGLRGAIRQEVEIAGKEMKSIARGESVLAVGKFWPIAFTKQRRAPVTA